MLSDKQRQVPVPPQALFILPPSCARKWNQLLAIGSSVFLAARRARCSGALMGLISCRLSFSRLPVALLCELNFFCRLRTYLGFNPLSARWALGFFSSNRSPSIFLFVEEMYWRLERPYENSLHSIFPETWYLILYLMNIVNFPDSCIQVWYKICAIQLEYGIHIIVYGVLRKASKYHFVNDMLLAKHSLEWTRDCVCHIYGQHLTVPETTYALT